MARKKDEVGLKLDFLTRKNRYEVRLDGRVVGHICQSWNRNWFYQPKGTGQRARGDEFPTAEDVYKSLETDGNDGA